MTRDELEKTVLEFMDGFTTMTLACAREEQPWAAAVYYARSGFDLFFFSSPESRHAEIFAENPIAAATIHGDYTGWREIKGLQMEGTVAPVKGAVALTRALATYVKRYPFAKEFLSDPKGISGRIAKKMAKVALYVFRPEKILYVNNEAGFGTRWMLEVKDGRAVGDPVRA
jgi:uncharacterized protein YhbP (UPF0306 family)